MFQNWAVKTFEQAIRLSHDDAEVHLRVGLAYIMLNDSGSAIEQYKILKTLDTELANELFDKIYRE